VITRTTLKTLWLAGGGVVATWLAVSPNRGATQAPQPITPQQSSSVQQINADDFSERAGKLRARTQAGPPRQSTRNPFRFTTPGAGSRNGRPETMAAPVQTLPPVPLSPPSPTLTLSGIAERKTASGVARTAVITSEGQLYLVGVGDTVGGRFTVASIEAEAVMLRGSAGEELRLVMRQ
jgi:hypothetical protein